MNEVLVARAYLNRVAEPGSLAVADFVITHGPVEAARLIRRGAVPGPVASATAARAATADGEQDLAAALRHGIRFLAPESADWPQFAFAPLYAAQERRLTHWRAGSRTARYGGEPTVPIGLWVRGPLPVEEMALRSAAIVGARAATAYGEQVALEFGYGLAAQDIVVVSGGAFGVDANAHRGALAAGGTTVLVSAGGLDRPYPTAHAGLFDEVAATGLLVSESPPGCAPQRHRFLTRNRIVAAFATVTVVVEAAARSGALNTATHGGLLGRPVLAVPGPITSAMSVGCHQLIARPDLPAQLVGSVDEVVEYVGGATGGTGVTNSEATGAPSRDRRLDDLDATARTVLDGLPARSWARVDDIAISSGIDVRQVLRALPTLELNGFIESGREGYRLVKAS